MILHNIELEAVGPFSHPVRIGPFSPAINILAAPNESGKTTSLRAAARALFDKHTTKGDEIKSLQPAGTDLSPRIAVEFETQKGRFLIEKTFLNSPKSRLQRWQSGAWQLLADADESDRRVQELLNSSLPGRKATKPEHWGLLGFLWARQGEPSGWPDLSETTLGQTIRSRLARIEIDPLIDQLRQRLQQAAEDIFTSTGQVRKNGPLAQAEAELASIEEALAALARTRGDIEDASRRYQQTSAEVLRLEKEHEERLAASKELNIQADQAEKGRVELDKRSTELESAKNALQTIARDAETEAARKSTLGEIMTAQAKADEAVKVAKENLAATRRELDTHQNRRPDLEQRLSGLRQALQRHLGLLKLRHATAHAGQLEKISQTAASASERLSGLREQYSRTPAISPARLKQLEDLFEKVRSHSIQVEALGISVDLTPIQGGSITASGETGSIPLPAGQTTSLHRPQFLDLSLPGWGQIRVRSGATEAQDIARTLEQEKQQLAQALQEAGVSSQEEARQAASLRKDLEGEIKTATALLHQHLGDHESVEKLRMALSGALQKAQTLEQSLNPSPDEQSLTVATIEAEEARLEKAIVAAEKDLVAFDEGLAKLRTSDREAASALERSTSAAGDLSARRQTLETQITDLAARYADGLETAKTRAQIAFAEAEARVAAARAALPPDFEKLPDRNRRAAVALQDIEDSLRNRRAERDSARGAVESLGGQGIYSRETDLEEKKADVILRRDAARGLGWAARISHDLIEHRKQAATRAILTPLEDRLSATFADLTGITSRRVFLDDNLHIAGIGMARDEAYAFEHLSQGAKEQLLLCLRIAVAQELSADEPQVLILDDVLVNTDSPRQERILDLLSSLSQNIQTLILTCHPDRYRGVGTSLPLLR